MLPLAFAVVPSGPLSFASPVLAVSALRLPDGSPALALCKYFLFPRSPFFFGGWFYLSENACHLFLMSGPSGVALYSQVFLVAVRCRFFFPPRGKGRIFTRQGD